MVIRNETNFKNFPIIAPQLPSNLIRSLPEALNDRRGFIHYFNIMLTFDVFQVNPGKQYHISMMVHM